MTCDDVRPQLTAYLDGELADDRGSAVRGHLRGCAGCRQAARDEAVLRDALRELPPIDPPATLWAGVQRQLAAAEVADAERPAWRRALARWASRFAAWARPAPRWGLAAVVAVAVATIAWRVRRTHDVESVATRPSPPSPQQTTTACLLQPAPPPTTVPADVTAELAGEPDRVTRQYADAASELLALAGPARAQWPDARQHEFDVHLAELCRKIDDAARGKARQRAYRTLVRYLQNTVVRDEIAMAAPRGQP